MKEPRDILIAKSILALPGLTDGERLLLARMENLSRKSGLAYASVDTYAGELGRDPRTIRRLLRRLERRGLIVQVRPGGGRLKTAAYRLALSPEKPGQAAPVSGAGNPDKTGPKPGQVVHENAGKSGQKYGQVAPQVVDEYADRVVEGEQMKRTPAPSAPVSDNGHGSNGPPDVAALAQRAWDASPRRPPGQTVADCESAIRGHIAQGAYTARTLAAYLDATAKSGGPVEFWKLNDAVPRFAKRRDDKAWKDRARLFASAPKGYLARRKADGATGIVHEWCNEAVTIRVTEPVTDWVRIETAEKFDEWEFTPPSATAAPDGRQARQDGPQAARADA
jgi:DNA-binding transcriptional ArsR family regulator